jgi:DNA-binding HxlR family transcriptional regulator
MAMSETNRDPNRELTTNGVNHDAAHCPAAQAMDLIAHKWTIHILFALHEAGDPVRFLRLQRAVAPITQKELTKRLRALERSGLVDRRVFAEVPPRVEYRLTELGSSLIPTLIGLHEWAERHGAAIAENWRRSATAALQLEDRS